VSVPGASLLWSASRCLALRLPAASPLFSCFFLALFCLWSVRLLSDFFQFLWFGAGFVPGLVLEQYVYLFEEKHLLAR
jgi:hypothetical protein